MQIDLNADKRSTHSSNKRIRVNKVQPQTTQGDAQDQNLIFDSPTGSSRNAPNLLVSFRPTKKGELSVSPRRVEYKKDQNDSDERCDSIGPSNGSTVHDQAISRYECIANLTEQQNLNLKQQNKYLLGKLRKMQDHQTKVKKLYQKAKKYKVLWQEAQMQIEALKDQCQIYKQQSEQMKKIILNDVCRLKQKVLETENQQIDHDTPKKEQQISQDSTQNKSGRLSSHSSLSKYIKDQPEYI